MGNWVLENAQGGGGRGEGMQVDGAAYSNWAFFPMLALAVSGLGLSTSLN